jgi:hypothetical protein
MNAELARWAAVLLMLIGMETTYSPSIRFQLSKVASATTRLKLIIDLMPLADFVLIHINGGGPET